MAEAGGATVDAMLAATSAMTLPRQSDGFGVEHRLGHLDHQIRDGEPNQRSEERPGEWREAEARRRGEAVRALPT